MEKWTFIGENDAGSLERNFVDNYVVALICKPLIYIVTNKWGRRFVVRVTYKNHEQWAPNYQKKIISQFSLIRNGNVIIILVKNLNGLKYNQGGSDFINIIKHPK